jgi:hypothetical protein
MKKTNPLWGSISILIGVVIAILALVRNNWEVPLLLGVFALWGAWLIITQLLPAWRMNRAYRRKERQLRKQQTREVSFPPDGFGEDTATVLLHHVNHRISAYLKSVYPKVRWEWTMSDPASFVAQGGTGRIRVYGVPDFDYVDVTLDQKANLSCALVKVVPVEADGADGAAPSPNQQILNPQVWYELRGQKTLEALITDLNSRGHSSLTLKEDGAVCIQQEDGGTDIVQDSLLDFPEKVYWPQLVKVLEQEGLAATAQDDGILVSWA